MLDKSFEIKGYINNVLKEISFEEMTGYDKAFMLNALSGLDKAQHSSEYEELIDTGLKEVNDIINESKDDAKYICGNVCYHVGKEDEAINIAGQINNQPRCDAGFFETADGRRSLDIAFNILSFYMNYETKNGGKEQYNDIIAQYNSLHKEVFTDTANHNDTDAVYELVLYAAGIADTLEVMDQALYEIFAALRDMYKETIAALNRMIDNIDSEKVKLIYSYAVMKGCRMKLIQTEKYSENAENIFKSATDKHVASKESVFDTAAYIMAYSEYIRNREYQDYGRNNGGVLWN